jgi:hypothetical protein
MYFRRYWLAILAFVFLTPLASFAYQLGLVIEDQVMVYPSADWKTTPLSKLVRGNTVHISSSMIKDQDGTYWFKAKLPNGVLGYVPAAALQPSAIFEDLAESGIQKIGVNGKVDAVIDHESTWNFTVRGMGMFGPIQGEKKWKPNAEGEVSFCIPFAEHGYGHRMLSLGVAYLTFANDPVLASSWIYRIYVSDWFEPELRLRAGMATASKTLEGGFNFGFNHPLGSPASTHVAAYAEFGSMVNASTSLIRLWGSLGLGLHF